MDIKGDHFWDPPAVDSLVTTFGKLGPQGVFIASSKDRLPVLGDCYQAAFVAPCSCLPPQFVQYGR